MYVNGNYNLYGSKSYDEPPMETVILNGNYEEEIINHPEIDNVCENIHEHWGIQYINGQSKYLYGNVLYRKDTDNIKELIDKFIVYTYHDLDDVTKLKSPDQVMMGGTICPTKKYLFEYKSKTFIAYGRYIFGYDMDYVMFKSPDTSVTNQRNIRLNCPNAEDYKYFDYGNEYVYSFMIYDSETKVLDAFGLYH